MGNEKGQLGKNRVTFRNGTLFDLERVMEIELSGSSLWKRDFFERECETTFSLFIVAEAENDIIGFAVAWDVPGEIQLQNIAVDSRWRRNGVASALLKEIILRLEKKNPEKIVLEVKESNTSAGSFYRKMGFFVTGIRKNYYGNENALLMEKPID